MGTTRSNMPELGTPAPGFTLPDVVSQRPVSLNDFAAHRALLVMFICHHCPFVQRIREELARLGRDYAHRDLGMVAISSNNPAVAADDSPEGLARMVADWGLTFPVLYDENQDVAKSYEAACTPDFFLFDSSRRLVYRGQLDDSRPNNGKPVTGADLRAAIETTLAGGEVSLHQKPSLGGTIKWRPGNAPAYVG